MPIRKKRGFYRPAPLWKRFLAFIIDMLVLEFFVFSYFEKIIRGIVPGTDVLSISSVAQLSAVSGVLGALVVTYFTVMEYSFGQTIGYMAANIRLIMQDASLWRIALSNVTFLPFFPFIILWVIDPLMIVFSNNHQRFMHTLLGMQAVEVYTMEVGNQWKQ